MIFKEYEELEKVTNKIYTRGFEDGHKYYELEHSIANDYEKGLNDAWEAARKIVTDIYYLDNVFEGEGDPETILEDYSASEAISRIKEYEEKHLKQFSDVKVGDKVRTIACKDKYGAFVFPLNTIGVVEEIQWNEPHQPYKIKAGDDYWYYSRDMFEVIDDKIKVYDEVYLIEGFPRIVTSIFIDSENGEQARTLASNGNYAIYKLKDLHKTGRSFPELGEILKQMKEYKDKMNDSLKEARDYHEIGKHTTSDSTRIFCDIRESEYKQAADEYKQIVERLEELKERQQNDR